MPCVCLAKPFLVVVNLVFVVSILFFINPPQRNVPFKTFYDYRFTILLTNVQKYQNLPFVFIPSLN